MKSKKHIAFIGIAILIIAAACSETPTKDACIINGDPNCNGSSSTGGHGGGYNCHDDPERGDDCKTDDGKDGHKTCRPDGSGLQCTPGTGGSGGDGGSGGSGGYNCHDDPNNGDECETIDGKPGHKGCNADGTALVCFPDGEQPPYNCAEDPDQGKPCLTEDGHAGVKGCNEDGTGLICHCSGSDCGSGPNPVYNCATDPALNTACSAGPPNSVCYATGHRICNQAGDGLVCNAVSAPPKAQETCNNGVDDNCNGNVDESPCLPDGSGSGGNGTGAGTGSGGGGAGGGDGGHGGGAQCTTASSITVTTLAPNDLTTLFTGEATVSNSDPIVKIFHNNNLLGFNAGGGVSVSVNIGKVNVWRPNSPGGDPAPLLDTLFCRQLGINPPTPASCNASVIGNRKSASWISALIQDFKCWRKGDCDATIAGHIPGDLFALEQIVENGNSFSKTHAGANFGIEEMPALCP